MKLIQQSARALFARVTNGAPIHADDAPRAIPDVIGGPVTLTESMRAQARSVVRRLNDSALHAWSVDGLSALADAVDGQAVVLESYHPSLAVSERVVGGGVLYFDATRAKAEHNGGTIISPTVPYAWGDDGAGYLAGVGETDAGGLGCFVRVIHQKMAVTDFGATARGIADEWHSVQATIDYLSSIQAGAAHFLPTLLPELYFPAGRYRVTKSINHTKLKLRSVFITGDGIKSSIIVGETGERAMLDLCGVWHGRVSGIGFLTGTSNASKCAIFMARDADNNQCGEITFDIYCDIPAQPTAYGGRGSVGVYTVSAEILTYNDCHIRAFNPLVSLFANDFGLVSDYMPISDAGISNTVHTLRGGCYLSRGGPVWTFKSGAHIRISSYGACLEGEAAQVAALHLSGIITDLVFDGDIEKCNVFAFIGGTMRGLTLKPYIAKRLAYPMFRLGGPDAAITFEDSTIDVRAVTHTVDLVTELISDADRMLYLNNCDIRMRSETLTLNQLGSQLNGTIINANSASVVTLANSVVSRRGSFKRIGPVMEYLGNDAQLLVNGSRVAASGGATGGAGSGGAGNQYVAVLIDGIKYKLLHDGVIA